MPPRGLAARVPSATIVRMDSPRPWLESHRMWVELVFVVVAVGVTYWVLGLQDTPPNPESPETDGAALDELFQVVGAATAFAIALTVAAGYELTCLLTRARLENRAGRISGPR